MARWKSKRKALGLEQVTGHKAKLLPTIRGRAPENSTLDFSPAELFGAMAQCASRTKMDLRAAKAHTTACRLLLEQHVDEKNDRFALLDTAAHLKDYFGKAMTGLVGDGIAYLQMVRDGYRWVDHFENHAIVGKRETKRSPDFVFCRSDGPFVALTEAKATRGSSKKGFDRTVRDGYLEQVEPHLGKKIGSWIASHGYAVGAWMKSTKRAEMFVHHTQTDPKGGASDDERSDPTSIKFGNYCGVVSLLFGAAAGEAVRSGQKRAVPAVRSSRMGSRS